MLAYRSWLSLTSLRLPKSASASSKRRIAPPSSAASKTRRRFFSVSPMYLLTTELRSIRYRSSSSSFASTSPAIVFPVPLGAREERRDPEAACASRGPAPVVVDGRAPAHVGRDLPEELALRLGEHEVLPARRRLDPLREVVEARSRLRSRGVPERRAQPDLRGRGLDPVDAELELARDAFEAVAGAPERLAPEPEPLLLRQRGHVHADDRPGVARDRVARADDPDPVDVRRRARARPPCARARRARRTPRGAPRR